MPDKLWRFLVEYENRNEFAVEAVPGDEGGESPKNRDLVGVLRILADEIEDGFPTDGDAPLIVYPPPKESGDAPI